MTLLASQAFAKDSCMATSQNKVLVVISVLKCYHMKMQRSCSSALTCFYDLDTVVRTLN